MCKYMWCNRVKVANGDVFETILRDISVLWTFTPSICPTKFFSANDSFNKAFQGRFHRWGCWGCIPLHQQCLLIWSNNINGPPRATAKHVVPPTKYSDMAMIMLVKCRIKSNT